MEIFQRNGFAVVGTLASSINKQGAHGGVFLVLLTPFPKIDHSSLGSSSVSSALWLLLNFIEQQKTSHTASLRYEI